MSIIADNYDELFNTMVYMGKRKGLSKETSQDLAQDSIMAMLEKEDTLLLDEVFKLGRTVMDRTCINWLNVESRRREIESESGESINAGLCTKSAETLAADPMELMAYDEMVDRLDALSPTLYATVQYVLVEGRSIADAALKFCCTENAIYQRLHQAKKIVTGDTNE